MMKIIAIAAVVGGIALLGVANQDVVSWPLSSLIEIDRGNCVEDC